MRLKVSAALFACLSVLGCMSVTPAGEKVRITSNPQAVRGCELVGEVTGKSSAVGTSDVRDESAMTKLKNAAAEKGADTVLIVTSNVGDTSATHRGEGYSCGTKQDQPTP